MSGDSTVTETTAKQLTGDVPLPPGAIIRQQDALVMGTGNSWTGRVNPTVAGDPQGMFTCFRGSWVDHGVTGDAQRRACNPPGNVPDSPKKRKRQTTCNG